jgi:hypothetical protein
MTDSIDTLFSWLIILLLVAAIWWVKDSNSRRRKEAIDKFIAKHEQALAKKRRQLVQQDAYGNENIQRWNKEKKYFINTALIPHLSRLDHYYDKEKLKALSASFDAAVEHAALRGLASLPASHPITDIATGQEYEQFLGQGMEERRCWNLAGIVSNSSWFSGISSDWSS